MGKKKSYIEKSSAGRPSIYSETIVEILNESFKLGCTVEQACAFAKIDKQTYYNWIESKPEFSTKMEFARNYLYREAKNLVNKAIIKDKDLNTAKWLLEKTEYKQTQQTNTQVNIQAPKPILGDLIDLRTEDVSTDNNTQENIETKEEN